MIFNPTKLEQVFKTGLLAVALADDDPTLLSAEQRVDALVAIAALQAQLAGREQRLLAAAATDPSAAPDWLSAADGRQWIREELACALTVSAEVVGARLHTARTLVERLGDMLRFLDAGRPDYYRARIIADAVTGLDDETAAAVQARVLLRAEEQTPTALRRSVNRAVARLNPQRFEDRHHAAVATRGVWASYSDDGMGELVAVAAADRIRAVMTLIDGLATAPDAGTGPDAGAAHDAG